MKNQYFGRLLYPAVLLAFPAFVLAAEQVRRQPGQTETVPVQVSLAIGSNSYNSNAPGTCTHAPIASIYGVLSEMWMVRQNEQGRSAQLTLWRSKKTGDNTFSFSLSGKQDVEVTTVKGAELSGSGTVNLEPSAKGGTFRIEAKTQNGETVKGTIVCPAFTPATAEGG